MTSRSEWCISRQRSWGVPIPALYDKDGRPLLDPHVVAHVIDVLEQKGTEHWWTGPIDDFLPLHLRDREVTKGTDTLDVWFDSGSSWTLLEGGRADYYLEGSDQHRGWFQSSLLTKLAVDSDETTAPYDKIISHGFVMDEQGQKMSKSAGNGVSPVEIALGTKVSRGMPVTTDTCRKNRGTARILCACGRPLSTIRRTSPSAHPRLTMHPRLCAKFAVPLDFCLRTAETRRHSSRWS